MKKLTIVPWGTFPKCITQGFRGCKLVFCGGICQFWSGKVGVCNRQKNVLIFINFFILACTHSLNEKNPPSWIVFYCISKAQTLENSNEWKIWKIPFLMTSDRKSSFNFSGKSPHRGKSWWIADLNLIETPSGEVHQEQWWPL